MIRYLLHGGNYKPTNDRNNAFFRDISVQCESPHPHILLCYWATEVQTWQSRAKKDSTRINSLSPKKHTFDVVLTPADLHTKLATADALYVSGGEAPPIEHHLPHLGFLRESLQGKVYAGSSMGAFIASNHYVLSNEDQPTDLRSGLSLITWNILCHWDTDTRRSSSLATLKNADPNIPILTLRECEYVSLYA